MYLHDGDESLGQPPRIPNPNLQQHCPVLRDMHGRYVAWSDYLNRTTDPKDPISRSLADLGERHFTTDVDLNNYIARCQQPAQPLPIPNFQPQPIPPELLQKIVNALAGIRWRPKPTDPTVPTTLKMRK